MSETTPSERLDVMIKFMNTCQDKKYDPTRNLILSYLNDIKNDTIPQAVYDQMEKITK